MPVQIYMLGLKELSEELLAIEKSLKTRRKVGYTGDFQDLLTRLQKATPGYPKGEVWKGWDYRQIGRAQELNVEFFNDNIVAAYLEFGVPPHPISAKRGGLAFEGTHEWAGSSVIRPTVKHPGFRATKFATKVFRSWLRGNRDIQGHVTVRVGSITL